MRILELSDEVKESLSLACLLLITVTLDDEHKKIHEERIMTIQKKSLINSLNTTKKALVASTPATGTAASATVKPGVHKAGMKKAGVRKPGIVRAGAKKLGVTRPAAFN